MTSWPSGKRPATMPSPGVMVVGPPRVACHCVDRSSRFAAQRTMPRIGTPAGGGIRLGGRIDGDDAQLAVVVAGEDGRLESMRAERPQHPVQLVGALVGEFRAAPELQLDRPGADVGHDDLEFVPAQVAELVEDLIDLRAPTEPDRTGQQIPGTQVSTSFLCEADARAARRGKVIPCPCRPPVASAVSREGEALDVRGSRISWRSDRRGGRSAPTAESRCPPASRSPAGRPTGSGRWPTAAASPPPRRP